MQDSPDGLDPLLDSLDQRTPASPVPLGPEIWRRIARTEEFARPTVWERVHAVFARPSFAAAFLAACMLLGLFLAEVRRSHRQEDYNRDLMQSYLRLIDPLLEIGDRAVFAQAAPRS